MKTLPIALCALALGALSGAQPGAALAGDVEPVSTWIQPVDTIPKEAKGAPAKGAERLAERRKAVEEEPKNRRHRFELVRELIAQKKFNEAREAAESWREMDAYNLVVVRLLGDIYSALGDERRAMRTYSAVVELLPKDAKAQRALAGVLKQGGKLEAARQRLQAALDLRPEDARIRFELADVQQRLGRADEAREHFEAIVAAEDTPKLLRYPAKERLAQNYLRQRIDKQNAGEEAEAAALDEKIEALQLKSGVENDLKIYLTWDTDRSDVDLWVTNPAGEKIFYSHKTGQFGGALFGDVTNGYGPESFTAKKLKSGVYKVQVNYYSVGSSNFPEARGEVAVVLDEGSRDERRKVLPYRLFEKGQTVTVAKIHVP